MRSTRPAGQHGARAYRLARAAGKTPAATIPAALSDYQRAILTALGDSDGMTCPEIVAAYGRTPGRREQNRCNHGLETLLGYRCAVRHPERREGPRGRARQIWVWQITDAGRAALIAVPGPPSAGRPPKADYAWAPDAQERYENGETLRSIARRQGVDDGTVRRVLVARGLKINRNRGGRPTTRPRKGQA